MAGLSHVQQVSKEMKKLGAKLSAAMTASAKEGWKTAVNNTPRDTGTAQAGWKLSTTRRDSYVPKRFNKPRPKVPSFRFRATRDKRVYLYNNVPYISHLEHGNPAGRVPYKMLRKAKIKMQNELEKRLK